MKELDACFVNGESQMNPRTLSRHFTFFPILIMVILQTYHFASTYLPEQLSSSFLWFLSIDSFELNPSPLFQTLPTSGICREMFNLYQVNPSPLCYNLKKLTVTEELAFDQYQ
ncbi:uncharacterized protein LOC124343818 isoform X2 [Daphnia pulicaria]|uniref:uncharacterized protein LOC124343818 isoform X2 n=1 Tax=Daphnia pulicaria TaxID=35523 RepID=UPI001EEC3B49|nr:uncharacterized protein LOC124343818 isoform X2 [Daphnia pulicaria]